MGLSPLLVLLLNLFHCPHQWLFLGVLVHWGPDVFYLLKFDGFLLDGNAVAS